MQNHAHNNQVESSELFPPVDLFPRLIYPSSSRFHGRLTGLGDGSLGAAVSEPSERAVRVLPISRGAIRSSSQLSERTALHHNWRFSSGDPIDGRGLISGSRQRLQPIAGDFLSTLEDDAAPVTRRDHKADEKFGCEISWVQPEFVDSAWAAVSLSDPVGTQADGEGVGWYRRTFESSSSDEGRHIGLEIIGGFGRYMVWLNGKCIGRPGCGSTGLRRDLTPYIMIGTNTLVIRVEDWTLDSEGAGMARSISLVKKDSLHLGPSGSAVTGVIRSGDSAELTISTILHNRHGNARRGTLCCALLDPAGRVLAEMEDDFHIFGQDQNLRQLRLTVDHASWLAENPGQYFIRTRIAYYEDTLDEDISPFDLRATLSDDMKDEFLLKMCEGLPCN